MRKLALALVAVFLVGVGTFAAPTVSPAAATSGPKVAIIVGATGTATSSYRTYANEIYAEAIAYTSNVVKVYSPNATWAAVKAAVNGASIVVYLGHGNGWPSPYTYDPKYTTKDGFGLNKAANGGDSNLQYYGEPYIATLTPAHNAVVLLFHLCYASGNSESQDAEPTLSVARQRVDNYASAFLKVGAGAVIADGHSHTGYVTRLFTTRQTVDQLWRGMPSANGHVSSYASGRTPDATYEMDPNTPTSGYYRSMAGSMSLTTTQVTGAAFASTDTDPTDFQVPGAASVAVDAAPVYATEADAAAAHDAAAAGGGAAADTAADSLPPEPVATLPMDDQLRVSRIVPTSDGAKLLDIATFDGMNSGWIIGDVATPRDSRSPVVWSVSDGNALFTPNGDGDRDKYVLTVDLSETASWTLAIENDKGSTLLAGSGSGDTATLTWDGTSKGALAPDGTYRWRLTAVDAWKNPPLNSTASFILNHDPITSVRYAGASRFATAADISAHTFPTPGVPVAYVANAYNFPDALAGAAAAGTVAGPVLLVGPTGAINASTAAELTRLAPKKIIVLGGTGAVSDAVLNALKAYATGGNVVRYAGASRFATAADISAHTFPTPGVPVAYVANAYNFPDALAGAAAAGTVAGPVLLVGPTGAINASTAAELTRLAPKKIIVLGGTGAVSDAVLNALKAYATGGNVVRYAGASRFATAADISAHTFPTPGVPVAYVANAYNFPDALAGAAAAGTVAGPVLLVGPTGAINASTAAELTRLAPKKIIVLGGTGAVSDAVLNALAAY